MRSFRTAGVVVLLVLLAGACSSVHETRENDEPVGIAATVASWFPVGEHLADIMDSVVYPARMVELTQRIKDSIAVHQDWFVEALKGLKDGEPMTYHPNMGLTEAEYAEYRSLTDSIVAFSSGQEQITIIMEDSLLGFRGTGRLDLLDMVSIDLKENTAFISDVALPFRDTVVVTDPANSFRSAWRGFSWSFDNPDKFDPEQLRDLPALTMTHYQVTVGRIERTGKTYLNIETKEIKDGVQELNFELPILF